MNAESLCTLAPAGVSPRLWIVAALAAGSLHLGLAGVAAWAMRADDADDDGAPAIELALDMVTPKTEQTDLPPGPEADASAAAPESAQSAAKTEQSERPREEPVGSENPDRIVAPETTKKPERETEQQQERQSEASTASVASEAAAAPQQVATREATVARAPVIGDGRQALRIRAEWQRRLFSHLSRHKRYPAGVAAHKAENRVVFMLDRLGHVVSARISKTSGDAAFDNAALDMMKRSDPVPPPPPLIADETLTFEIPVQFRAGGR